MSKIEFQKMPKLKILFVQFNYILGLEMGLFLSYLFVDFSFYTYQLILLPIIIYLLISQHTKSVTGIYIDHKSRIIKLTINYFLIYNKCYDIPFNEFEIKVKWKWLLNFNSKVIELKKLNRSIAIIPFKMSIWKEAELNNLVTILSDLSLSSAVSSAKEHR
jgi:hypothetical protein